jgi:hypothetical protein
VLWNRRDRLWRRAPHAPDEDRVDAATLPRPGVGPSRRRDRGGGVCRSRLPGAGAGRLPPRGRRERGRARANSVARDSPQIGKRTRRPDQMHLAHNDRDGTTGNAPTAAPQASPDSTRARSPGFRHPEPGKRQPGTRTGRVRLADDLMGRKTGPRPAS